MIHEPFLRYRLHGLGQSGQSTLCADRPDRGRQVNPSRYGPVPVYIS